MDKSINYILPIIVGAIVFSMLVVFIIYFILLYRKSQDKYLYEQELLKQEFLAAEAEISEETLKNVSRELHDNYGQIASLIKINLNLISSDLSDNDQAKVQESIVLVKQLIQDIRSLSANLNGDKIKENGWISMIENEVARINRIGHINYAFELDTEMTDLGHEKELILFRITQEIFNNMLKYSQATEGSFSMVNKDNTLLLTYKDNGRGFDINNETNQNGSGLKNIRERAKLIGASCLIKSEVNKGTEIQIIL